MRVALIPYKSISLSSGIIYLRLIEYAEAREHLKILLFSFQQMSSILSSSLYTIMSMWRMLNLHSGHVPSWNMD